MLSRNGFFDVNGGEKSCAYLEVLDATGVPLDSQPWAVTCGAAGLVHDLDVTTFGNTFLVAISEKVGSHYQVLGRRIDEDGAAIDEQPFELSPAGSDATGVALTSDASSARLGYSRATDAIVDPGRVYTRTILLPRRTRAVR